ncbi:MAG: CopG family ribbon-helix-helix protein [Candidatus Helarchaeota archaeon]
MPIVSISLTSKILDDLEKLTKERGYFSRSEAIRDAIRSTILEHDLSLKNEDDVFSIIITINEFKRSEIDAKLSRLRHESDDLVIENIHRHIRDKYCLELFVVEGKNSEVIEFIGRIRGIRGISQVKFVILPLM